MRSLTIILLRAPHQLLPLSLIAISLLPSSGAAIARNVVDTKNVLPEKWSDPPIRQKQQLPESLPTAIYFTDYYPSVRQNSLPAGDGIVLDSSGAKLTAMHRPSKLPGGGPIPTALVTATKPVVVTSSVPATTAAPAQESESPSPYQATLSSPAPSALATASLSSSSSSSSTRAAATRGNQGANPMAVNGAVATMDRPSALCAGIALVLSTLFLL